MKLPELVYQDESRNNRSCRVGDRDADPYAKCERKIAFLDIPMERKKFVATIWKPTIGKTAKTICKPYTAASISSGSVVNMRTITDGNN